MKNKILKLSLGFAGLMMLGFPLLGFAQISPPPQDYTPDEVEFELQEFLENLALWIFYIVIALAIIFILVAAIGFLTAGGNPEKIEKARSQLIYALIAVAVAVLAWGLVTFVAGFFGAGG